MSKVITKATTASFTNPARTTDWTDRIERLPNEHSFLKGMNMFNTQGTSQLSVTFDEIFKKRMIHSQTKRGGQPRYGSDRKADTHALVLPYWADMDTVTAADVQSYREWGTPDQTKAVASAISDKMTDLRGTVDELHEYLMFSALTGQTKDADGSIIFDAYDEFGETQKTQDFAFSAAGTNINVEFYQLADTIAKAKSTAASGIDIIADPAWFQALISNSNYQENNKYQQGTSLLGQYAQFYQFGVVGMLEINGGQTRIFAYNPEFQVEAADGTVSSTQILTAGTAIAMPRNSREMFRGWYGPSATLSGQNSMGREMFAEVYRDPRDKFVEVGVETSALFINTDPAATVLLTNS